MRIKLDENMPAALAGILAEFSHDTDTAPGEGLAGHSDDAVWNAAQREQRFLITQDMDFSDLRPLLLRTHAGLMLVRLRVVNRRRLIDRIREVFSSEQVEGRQGALVIVTENKVRVRTRDE